MIEKFWTVRYSQDSYKSSPYKDDISWLTDDAVWWARVIILTLNTVMFYYPRMVKISFGKNFVWLSLLAVQFTEYSLLTSIYAGKYTYGVDSLIDYKALATLLNTASQSINLTVTLVSWVFIMPWVYTDEKNTLYYKIDSTLIHSLPLLFTTINIFMLSDTTLYFSDSWVILVVAVLYLSLTYYYTKKSGEYVYYFLTWEEDDDFSKYFAIITVVLTFLIHTCVALSTQLLRGRSEFESKWWD